MVGRRSLRELVPPYKSEIRNPRLSMAGIIKAGSTRCEPGGVQSVAFNFDDMSREAHGYLDVVRDQAAQIVARANEEAEEIRRRAAEQGRKAALQAAEATVRTRLDQQLQSLVPALSKAIEEIKLAKQTWLASWEASALRTAVAIAERIVRRELVKRPDIAAALMREALELATGAGRIKLRLNPQDFATLSEKAKELAGQMAQLAPTDIVADPLVSPGGCIVNTEFGEIDQRIESQLARIEQELT